MYCHFIHFSKANKQSVMSSSLFSSLVLMAMTSVLIDFQYAEGISIEQYLGCYRDADNRSMGSFVVENDSVSLDFCSKLCEQRSTTFFGVEVGRQCFCADEYAKNGLYDECTYPCDGNKSQICGGPWALNVYLVCQVGYFGTNCADVCHCLNDTQPGRTGAGCYINGTCPAGCQAGWTGATCGTVCPVGYFGANCADVCHCRNDTQPGRAGVGCYANGTCPAGCQAGWTGATCGTDINECNSTHPLHNCTQNCSNTVGSYICWCTLGYTLGLDDRTCNDIDECTAGSSGCQQNCTNIVGSYKCFCGSGYKLDTDDRNCIDIDECLTDTHNCQQNCINAPGSYSCSCTSGFRLAENGRNCTVVDDKGSSSMLALLALLAIIPVVIIIVFVVFCLRRRRNMAATRSTSPMVSGRHLKEADKKVFSFNITTSAPKESSTESAYVENDVSPLHASPLYSNLEFPPSNRSKTSVAVTELPTVVARIGEMPKYFKTEFETLPQISGAKCDFAEKPELKKKNRFKNIIPYDDNRVILTEQNNDPLSTYINASFIRGYTADDKLIASHGPLLTTLDDFWRMIWQYNVGVIVMVTKCHESGKKKCEQYWPDTENSTFGQIKVEPHLVEERPDRTVRKFNVSKDGEQTRMLTQIQFVDWPDHGVPEHAVSLLAIRHAVKRIVGRDQYIIVHCSAGVGRSGSYLAIDYLLSQAAEERFVDVYSYVEELREQRMNSVQTVEQYSFIFKALLEGLTLGETSVPVKSFTEHVAKLHSRNPMTKKSFLLTEFEMLQEMQPLPDAADCSGALSEANAQKNVDRQLVPMDSRRVYLHNRSKGGTDYINAIFVASFQRKNAYISTQRPMSNTVGDFWNMCVDHKCRVVVVLSRQESTEDTLSFLPKSGDSLQFGKTNVGQLNELSVRDNETCQMFSVVASRTDAGRQNDTNIYANTQSLAGDRVTIIHVVLPEDAVALRTALLRCQSSVSVFLSGLGSSPAVEQPPPVVIMSRDGVVHCGQFIAVCNLCDMINTQQEVDVFQTVYNIKRAQPHFFTNMADYEELYKTAETHVRGTTVYYNS